MNNLNLSQNSNNLKDSSKTQEKLYSNEVSLDDILTYSDDNSQNQSYNKSLSKQNISIKESQKNEAKQPIINSFNSEITISFLNQNEKEKINNTKNKEKKFPKSACKLIYKTEKINFNFFENKKFVNRSCNNKPLNLINLIKNENDIFEDNIGNNLRDVSDFHASISNIFSEFEIKEISISKSNNEFKKNNTDKDNNKLNNIENNKIQISEEHSNTNSMCNYQNISNINDISRNNIKNSKKDLNKDKYEKNKKVIFSSGEIGEINIKMNNSLDNCNKNFDKNNYLYETIAENEINKKDNYTTSNKKESSSFYAQETKQIKNSIKYTKAQCVQALFQNKEIKENKQYILSDAPIKTKDTTSDKKTSKKIVSLSPHKLSFEIQKNDCIQISYKKNNKNKSNKINNDLNDNISLINNNTNSELSISKIEETNSNNNNYFYNNDCLKQNNTTSFMISSNINNNINKFIHRKIGYQKNNSIKNKKIFINNRNINIHKEESNNFFYNPNNPLASGPILSSTSNNKKFQNELHTPDLNKKKMTPMTCVHKGSLIYCNETNGNNSIKYNYSNNAKGNQNGNNNKNTNKKVKLQNQKKLVYLKNNVKEGKNSRDNKGNVELNSKVKQVTIINNKNNSFIKIKNNENNQFNTIIKKNKGERKNSKINTKKLIKKKKISAIININNNSYKKTLTIKNSINNNSINSNNNRRIIRGMNKIKTKSNSIINKINNEIIKESSLFHILYNMPQRNVNTTKENSGISSKDEKEATIIQKNSSKEKEKEKVKKISQKKLIKHNTNNSFSLYNSFFEKILDDSKKKNNNKIISKEKNNNKSAIRKNFVNLNTKREKSHKKIKSELNFDSLTSNFNFNNLNIIKRRKNNKSLYNFGNIFFINQNQIVKNELESNNSNINNIKYINKKIKGISKNKVGNKQRYENNEEEKNNGCKDKNKLIISTKYNPRIINDFSKYRKKKEINIKEKSGQKYMSNKIYNKQEYKETQLISEN